VAITGLDYFGARYHSGPQGRFTSVDPGQPDPDNPQSWNRYSYVLNNPLKYVDPDGANPVLFSQILNLIQRAAATPAGQRYIQPAINFAQAQGARLFNAATQFFNSPTGQELTQGAIETIGGVPLGLSISPRSVLAREVNAALQSADAAVRLEAQVAAKYSCS
jgi:RHS repeat-associated protein